MKRVFNLLVVDESGSMEIIRKQALMGINETLETIRKIDKAHNDLLRQSARYRRHTVTWSSA